MVRLINVRKRFGDNEVLKGINLEVLRGKILVIIGPSGSGKSTLLRAINHLGDRRMKAKSGLKMSRSPCP